MQNKLKHLEFIKAVITRLNSNSFTIKGWTMGLVTAIAALAYKEENKNVLLMSLVVITICWVTDAFFLCYERRYRALYNEVRQITNDNAVDFNMELSHSIQENNTWLISFLSNTLAAFYFSLLLFHIAVLFYYLP